MRIELGVPCATVVLSLLLGNPTLAEACTALACDPGRVLTGPPANGVVPSTASALAAEVSWGGKVQSMELRGLDAAVPPTVFEHPSATNRGRAFLKLPSEPGLQEGGHYELRVVTRCETNSLGEPEEQTKVVPFTAGPAGLWPARFGPAQVTYFQAKVGGRAGTSRDGAIIPGKPGVNAVVAQIALDMTAELKSHLPVVQFTTYVDGELWAQSHYGSGWTSYEPSSDVTIRDFTRIHAFCDPDGRRRAGSCSPAGATLGRHTVYIRAEPAGVSSDLASNGLEFDIDLQCPGNLTDAGSSEDAGLADSGISDSGVKPGWWSPGDGCTMGGFPAPSRSWTLLVSGALGFALYRRRASVLSPRSGACRLKRQARRDQSSTTSSRSSSTRESRNSKA